jgi:hypothetical protein
MDSDDEEEKDVWQSMGIFFDKLKTYVDSPPVAALPTPELQPKESGEIAVDEKLIQGLSSRLGKRSWSDLKEHWNDCAQCVVEINHSKSEELLLRGKPENALNIIVANDKLCNVVGGKRALSGVSFG